MNLVDSCGWLEYFADSPRPIFMPRPWKTRGLSWSQPSVCWKYSNGFYRKGGKMPRSRRPQPCTRD